MKAENKAIKMDNTPKDSGDRLGTTGGGFTAPDTDENAATPEPEPPKTSE